MLAGCAAAPTRPDRTGHTDAVTVDASVSAAGIVTVRSEVTFESADGGSVGFRAPVLATASNLSVDGNPRADTVTGDTLELRVRARTARLTFDLTGAVERHADVAVVTLPVWAVPSDAGRGDPLVTVTGTIQLPVPPLEDSMHWHGAVSRRITVGSTDGSTVRFAGRVTDRRDADVVVVLPSSAVPDLPVLGGGPRGDYLAGRQAALDRADRDLAADLEDDRRRDDVLAALYWAAVGLEVALPFAVAGPRVLRNAARRRRAVAAVPPLLFDPPGDQSPAVVALLARDGHDVGTEAVAGTILDLAHRGVADMDGVTSDRFRMTVRADVRGANAAEDAVLDALREAGGTGGVLEGPPLAVKREGPWWRAFRRDTLRQAKEENLVQRRYPSGVFLTAVVLLTTTTLPLWARTPEAAVGGLVVAAILCMLPFVGGYVLTFAGHRVRAEWEAFGRRARESSDIENAPPRAVAVWGPYLSYGAALGIAPAAVEALAP